MWLSIGRVSVLSRLQHAQGADVGGLVIRRRDLTNLSITTSFNLTPSLPLNVAEIQSNASRSSVGDIVTCEPWVECSEDIIDLVGI